MADESSLPAGGKKRAGAPRLFRAFYTRPYRWLWVDILLSSMGRTAEMLAQGWLVLLVTDSALWVGVVSGMRGVGTVGFGLVGGVIVDRVDRRKALMASQLFAAVVALTIGLLVMTENIEIWHLLVASVTQGMMQAVGMPARNALTYDVVGRRGLLNALALNMMAFNGSRVVGGLVAGVLIDTVGVEGVYMLMAACMAGGAGVLQLMGGSYIPSGAREPMWRNARDGLTYVWSNGPVRSLLLMSLLVEAFAFSYHVMLPVMARDELGVEGFGFGLLASATGVGALVSTAMVAYVGDVRSKGRLVIVTGGGFGLFLVVFALTPFLPFSFVVAIVALLLVGAMSMAYDATMGALLQLLVPDAVRGRVMGLYVLTFGFTPLGGFFAGAVASILGAPIAIGLGGGIVVAYVLGHLKPTSRIREADTPAKEMA